MKLRTLPSLFILRFLFTAEEVSAWIHGPSTLRRLTRKLFAEDPRPSGSFFNQVPDEDSDPKNEKEFGMEKSLEALIRERTRPSRATEPSTINGVPSHKAGIGFGKQGTNNEKHPMANVKRDGNKPYVGIGPVLNDVTKPEYDDQGYTLYADEETGKRSRVFEALVKYPCLFTIKIVGAAEGGFLQDMLSIVATTCGKDADAIQHSIKRNGKWTSITVKAPVDSAEMLYQLYENIDRDPRVRFKF